MWPIISFIIRSRWFGPSLVDTSCIAKTKITHFCLLHQVLYMISFFQLCPATQDHHPTVKLARPEAISNWAVQLALINKYLPMLVSATCHIPVNFPRTIFITFSIHRISSYTILIVPVYLLLSNNSNFRDENTSVFSSKSHFSFLEINFVINSQ